MTRWKAIITKRIMQVKNRVN